MRPTRLARISAVTLIAFAAALVAPVSNLSTTAAAQEPSPSPTSGSSECLEIVCIGTAIETPDVGVTYDTYPSYNADGSSAGLAEWRVVTGTGNCCENYLTSTSAGRLIDLGADAPFFSDDAGQTWKKAMPSEVFLGAEGAVVTAPNGDIVGMTWDPYTGDRVVTYKYNAEMDQWLYLESVLHFPFFDRPWIAVADGPFIVGGQTVPYLTVMKGGVGAKDILYYSLDGLNYTLMGAKDLEQIVRIGDTEPLSSEPDLALDWIQPQSESELTPIPGGGLIAQDLVDSNFAIMQAPDLKWNDLDLGISLGRLQIDSTGRLHHIRPFFEEPRFIYEISTDGGKSWLQQEIPLPDGYVIEDFDFRVNGARGMAAIAVHGNHDVDGTDQDMVYRMTFPSGIPTVDKLFYVGDGDAVVGSGVTATGQRFDFSTIAILPDGSIALSFVDASHDDPAVAILTNEDAGPDPSVTPTPTPTPTPTSTPSPSPNPTTPAVPNDPRFDLQWGLEKVRAPEAWALANGSGTKVAVISSGVDLEHEDLQCPGKLEIIPGSDLIDDDHHPDDSEFKGTHAAGIIGACTDNGTGVAGVAPGATLLPIRAKTAAEYVEAIDMAVVAGAHVIFLDYSYGFASDPSGEIPASSFADVARRAARRGVVMIMPSGSSLLPYCEEPASDESVLCVGAVDRNDVPTTQQNQPNKLWGPAVVAPGGAQNLFCEDFAARILVLHPVELTSACSDTYRGYAGDYGSSLAAAHVAGAAALVYDRLGDVRSADHQEEIVAALVETAHDLGVPDIDPIYGSGAIDAAAAVSAVTAPAPAPIEPTTLAFTMNSASTAQYSDGAAAEALLTDSSGAAIGGALVTFELTDGDSARSWTVVTDDNGVATAWIDASQEPGAYRLSATFDGLPDVYTGSRDATGFVIEKEDTTLDLTVEGTGRDRTLYANLVAPDDSTQLVDREIVFFADGREVCVARTGATGSATCVPPANMRGGSHIYEAVFRGDPLYLRSEDRHET